MLKFKTFEELLENEGLKKKSAKSGISYGTLKKVYNRGMAAWRTGHRPGTTPQQWGMARVNSYIGKGKGTYYGADSDLSGKGKKKKNKESFGEAHDPKHIKQAIGIASDPRYAKGNMTGAVKAMNKLSKDIHKHPQVAAVLRKQNEALDKKDTDSVKKVIKGLKGAVKAHSGQVKSLTKDIKDDVQVKEISKGTLDSYIKKADADKSKKHVRADVGKMSRDDAHKNQVKRNKGIELAKAKMKPARVAASEATVKEISKNLAKNYMGKAARDMYHKGQQQGNKDAISRLGGPDQDYMKSPERKASMRVRGIDRATNRLMKKEDNAALQKKLDKLYGPKKGTKKEAMSDAEKAAHQKAIDAFKMKGGKVKKLPPGYADGYHGKADPGAGIKGMISKADTKDFGTKKKVRSMK